MLVAHQYDILVQHKRGLLFVTEISRQRYFVIPRLVLYLQAHR